MAANAEKARAKRRLVKEEQSARDEDLHALRLLCSTQAEELQQLPPDDRARRAENAQAKAERQAREAQETSARAQAANSNLVAEVHASRSIAAAAGAEAKQARREARAARDKLEQVQRDHLVHLGEAVAVAVHGAEQESLVPTMLGPGGGQPLPAQACNRGGRRGKLSWAGSTTCVSQSGHQLHRN
jgi:hypothetical protein